MQKRSIMALGNQKKEKRCLVLYFQYPPNAIEHLKACDPQMKMAIETIGHINRITDQDLFSSVVHHIIGQQISTKAQATIFQRMQEDLKEINASTIILAGETKLQSYGITFRKANYILDFAQKVKSGTFDIAKVASMSDEQAINTLIQLKGIGKWTAEMILLFCLQRPNILSYDDLAIQRGLRMLYHHRQITPKLFAKYQRRFTPYNSVASLYLWAIASGQIPNMKDYAPKNKKKEKKSC